MKIYIALLIGCLATSVAFGQEKAPDNWFNLDMKENSSPGISTERAYRDLLNGKSSTKVIVAVLDSGVDIEHEDLADNIWVNGDEIADNGIDDDGNGYVDDVHGWNFIGGPNGDVHYDNLEFTRVYKDLRNRFNIKSSKKLTKEEKKDQERYAKMHKQYTDRVAKAEKEAAEFQQIVGFYELSKMTVREITGKQEVTLSDLEQLDDSDEFLSAVKGFMAYAIENNFESEIEEGKRHYNNILTYSYNLDYDSREIVGDDYSNPREKYYGNNHVEGPAAEHGTHVAGIIGAVRNNDLGINGVADNVEIMVLRCVPDGDERDKDVANAIRYAVDNGAKVINMSFGKSYSPDKIVVDEAMKYAEEKGVLMVHAAGNSNRNNDKSANFPNPVYEDTREICPVWIEVGASGWDAEDEFVASFSNYGPKSVDVFAPGVDLDSTIPQSDYKVNSGTSMAAPVVSGIAAVLFSYFPELEAKDVKEIIVNSYVDYGKAKVNLPGSKKKVKFKKLSRTGGLVSLYNAVKMAQSWESKQAKK